MNIFTHEFIYLQYFLVNMQLLSQFKLRRELFSPGDDEDANEEAVHEIYAAGISHEPPLCSLNPGNNTLRSL